MCYKKISCLRVACFLTPIFLVGDHCDYGVYSDLLWRNGHRVRLLTGRL